MGSILKKCNNVVCDRATLLIDNNLNEQDILTCIRYTNHMNIAF